MKDRYDLPCNIAQTLNIVGDRWTLLIIHDILVGRTTFNEMKKSLAGISAKILSDRLKYLEEVGLVSSSLYSDHPPRYRYTLTESGRDLNHVFHSLILWGQRHLETCYKKMIHQSCRHELELSYYCPHCQRNVDDIAIVEAEAQDRVKDQA